MRPARPIITILQILLLGLPLIGMAKTLESQNKGTTMAATFADPNMEAVQGKLINADEVFFILENGPDENVQVVPRDQVALLEMNLDINLFQVMKDKSADRLTDRIELEDGTQIPCIILDITSSSIQYFTAESLKRSQISTDQIYQLHLSNDTIHIPYPMVPETAALTM